MIELYLLDPVDAQVIGATSDELKLLRKQCSFRATTFIPHKWGKEKKTWDKTLMWSAGKAKNKKYYLPIGFLQRIEDYCHDHSIEYKIIDGDGWFQIEAKPPSIPGITLREDQVRQIRAACNLQRGVLKAPTGTGKTILMMGVLSSFDSVTLILVHNLDILKQTLDELDKHSFDAHQVGDGERALTGRIVVGTRQSISNAIGHKWLDDVDVVMIDECHKFGDEDGQYGKILRSLIAPVRIGFTATMPQPGRPAMALEGMVGPIIDEVTYAEGHEKDLLTMPEIILVPVPISERIEKISKKQDNYKQTYLHGIVRNKRRNVRIMRWASKLMDEGRTVLIFVNRIDHGDELLGIAASMDVDVHFVRGETDTKARVVLKKMLNTGEAQCVISSPVWREGLNIPTLGAVILGGGMKSETSTLQAIGRALRKVDGKDTAPVVDFVDKVRYLAEHTCHRISTYIEMEWL